MKFLNTLSDNLKKYNNNIAFHIKDVNYTYKELAQQISNIRFLIKSNIKLSQKNVVLIVHDDIETYASILALWFEGKAYIPISPNSPLERNKHILNEVKSNDILSSKKLLSYAEDFNFLQTNQLTKQKIDIELNNVFQENLSYILFTSGSTGYPKGVPITFKNLDSLVKNIEEDTNHSILPNDKCLQMFDLTFDFSVVTYLMPLLNGATIFTIPENQIKYLYIYKLINKHSLTYLIMVPSIIQHLEPYFDEINATCVRYCCFGAAPLKIDILERWKKCIPNAKLYNSYGPTEFTVTTSYYSFQNNPIHKTRNGVVSLGKVMKNITAIIIDENQNILSPNKLGELCLAGLQLTKGYLNNENKNKISFFTKKYRNENLVFYKTGDLCLIDDEGYLLFGGRKDFQVKVNGYRVELFEIEYHAKAKLKLDINMVALNIDDHLGNTKLGLAIESEMFDIEEMITYMKSKMPNYMIPTQTKFIKEFPYNNNGKIDRNALKKYFNSNE